MSGLAPLEDLARELVAVHGGGIAVAATGPQGTTFRIDLPL